MPVAIAYFIEAGLYEGLWMAFFPNREAEILALAELVKNGLEANPAIFASRPPHPMLINLKKATLVDQPRAGPNWNTVSSQLIRRAKARSRML